MNYKIGKRYFSSNGILIPAILMIVVGSPFLYSFLMAMFSQGKGSWLELFSAFASNPEEALALSWIFVLCLGLPLCGILMLVFRLIRRVSDEGYEQAIAQYPQDLVLRARKALSFPETEELKAPAMIFEDFQYHDVGEVKKNQGLVRTDLYQKSAVLLAEQNLNVYSLTFRTVKQEESVNVESIPYRDVVSVTFAQTNEFLRSNPICIKTVEIATASGKVIKLPYRCNDKAEQDVKTIRQAVQEKKSATENGAVC